MHKIKLILGALALLFSSIANSSIYDISGSWLASDIPKIGGPFAGLFSLTYDDTSAPLTGVGHELLDLPLDSFSFLGDNYGGFDSTNSGVSLHYYDRNLTGLHIAGAENSYHGIGHFTDDFAIGFGINGPGDMYFAEKNTFGIQLALYGWMTIDVMKDGDQLWGYDNEALRVFPSAVPVPAAIWLFGTALIGLIGFSKRRKAA